jgi:beta-glucoside operon transcriptional antiterminator
MKILRVFNNNVVLARDQARGDVVLTGRGLGFQAKPGQQVDAAHVAMVFVADPGRDVDLFGSLVAAIPPEHVALADEALASTRKDVDPLISSATVVALADHISFAIKRVRQGIAFEYPLRAEVAHLYPDELAAARRVVDFVNERIQETLPEDEAVAIALHLVNAGFATGDLSYTYQMTWLFPQLFDVVEQSSGSIIDRHTVNAARFITHLRYFFVRAHHGSQLDEGSDHDPIASAIRSAYPWAYVAATRLQAVLELRLGQPLTEDEVTYLTLHVARMLDVTRS